MDTKTQILSLKRGQKLKIALHSDTRWLWLLFALIFLSSPLASDAAQPGCVPGRILVRTKSGLSETNFIARLKNRGTRQRYVLHRTNVRVVEVAEKDVEKNLAALRNDPDVEFAERDYLGHAAFVPDDALITNEWHLASVEAFQSWNLTTGGTNTIVAVLDSGVNPAHPDLAGQLLPGYDFVNGTTTLTDDFGHGTAVIGTVAAAGNNNIGVAGVAYGCRVLPVKVMDASGFAAYSTIAEGIRFAVDQGARVINISIVGSSPSVTLQDAIDYAWSNNVVIIASAGNNANDVPQYPAACSNVVSVSATEPDNSLATFSSYGNWVTLSAPGDNIWTTCSDPANPYAAWRGTSFSSPIVAGVAALVASANPSLSNTQIVSLLEQTAVNPAGPGYNSSFGFGIVNAFQAVNAAMGQPLSSFPTISFTSPANSAQFPLGAVIPLSVAVAPGNGTGQVISVTYFTNGAPLTSSTTVPFALNWTPDQAGNYTLTAAVMDSLGESTTSTPVAIQVLSSILPTVIITNGPPNLSRVFSPSITLAGKSRDKVPIDHVEAWVNGSGQLADGTTNWSAQVNLVPGTNFVQVRAVDGFGNASPFLTRRIFYVVDSPLTVLINGFGAAGANLNGKMLDIGRSYTIRAVPGPGQLFAGWSGDISQIGPVLNFMMQSNLTVIANFVPSPFPPVQGTYTGLLADTNAVTPASSGSFSLTVGSLGGFSGRLKVASINSGFSGKFDLAGNATVTIKRGPGLLPLTMALHVELTNGTDQVTGSITDGGWAADVLGDRNVFNGQSNPAAQAGLRAFILERADDAAITAAAGASRISPGGKINLQGKLDDGRVFTTSSALSKNGDCPFYLSLSKGNEVVIGWLNFPTNTPMGAGGTVIWVSTGTNAFAATLRAASAP